MKNASFAAWLLLILAGLLCVILANGPAPVAAPVAKCRLRMELIDAETGKPIPGLVQVRDEAGELVELPGLLDRGLGLPTNSPIHDWSVIVRPTEVLVPAGSLTVRGFAGLETAYATQQLELAGKERETVTLKLVRFAPVRAAGWQTANTHVHLKKTSRAESDRYLIEAAQGDELDIVFVSYLERPSEDMHYSTNKYRREEIQALSNQHTAFDYGEEHRHNFTAWEEGYGHIMLLDIPELIYPVSIGPGITGKGTDGTPVRTAIDKAQAVGGKVIWCHNHWGLEDVPNWIAGRLHANNIFDGGIHGSYEHSFYRYLNAGLSVPFSTGTDWFMYDFNRVYTRSDQPLSPHDWLAALAAGKTYITNGPLLEFSVAGRQAGESVSLDKPGRVRIVGRGQGRIDFAQLQLIQNGRVIRAAETKRADGHYTAELALEVDVAEPCWFALRTPAPSHETSKQTTPLNEYGGEIFAHTSAVFVDLADKRIFHIAAAKELMAEMERSRKFIAGRAKFANEQERARVLSVYDEAMTTFGKRIAAANRE